LYGSWRRRDRRRRWGRCRRGQRRQGLGRRGRIGAGRLNGVGDALEIHPAGQRHVEVDPVGALEVERQADAEGAPRVTTSPSASIDEIGMRMSPSADISSGVTTNSGPIGRLTL
jgi:hypothetical protein